jgi:hypothetical protein
MKEWFIAAHEDLICEWLEARFPDGNYTITDEQQAYIETADLAHDRMVQNLADRADFLRDRD